MPVTPMTYVYGVLHAAPTDPDKPWYVSVDYPWRRRGVKGKDLSGGRYVLGPFPPGEVVLKVGRDSAVTYHPHFRVTGKEDGPIEFNIDLSRFMDTATYAPAKADVAPGTVMMGMDGISSRAGGVRRLIGQVFMADGFTPALAAQVLYFLAHSPSPSLLAFADAAGTSQPRGLWRTGSVGNTVKLFLGKSLSAGRRPAPVMAC